MTFNYTDLNAYLNAGNFFDKFDYVYEHSKAGYPLTGDFDAKDLFMVTNVTSSAIDVLGVTSGVEKTIQISTMKTNWWILSLPPNAKSEIFYYKRS